MSRTKTNPAEINRVKANIDMLKLLAYLNIDMVKCGKCHFGMRRIDRKTFFFKYYESRSYCICEEYGKTLDSISLVMLVKQIGFRQALAYLAAWKKENNS